MWTKKANKIILISMDCVRPDHLGCFGNKKISTPNIDLIAQQSLVFENVITASCLTPVSMASILAGKFPPHHGLRDPFGIIQSETIAEVLNQAGCRTAAFVGIDFLSQRCHFHKGFDLFREPTVERSWHRKEYQSKSGQKIETIWGYWWIDEFLNFIDENYNRDFFIWGHYFETHVAAERWLLKSGLIKENVNAEWDYYDAKIECLDKQLFAPLIDLLKTRGIWEEVTLAIVSDHGETFDEHPHKQSYAQHQSMYNTDLQVPLVIKHPGLEPGRVKHKVRTVDLAPTLLKLTLGKSELQTDGEDLCQIALSKRATNLLAYSEDIYELRGYGSLQAIQDAQYKLIRNNTTKEEEFYDLKNDHEEKINLIKAIKYQKIITYFRTMLDQFLNSNFTAESILSESEKEKLKIKLRSLGYID